MSINEIYWEDLHSCLCVEYQFSSMSMISSVCRFCICVLSLCFVWTAQAELHFCKNHPDEIRIMKKAQRLAKRGDWAAIENWLIQCENERLRTDNGELQLMYVHYGVAAGNHLNKNMPDQKWEEWLSKIERWEPEAQRSDIVASLKLDFWGSYAWKARSNSRANKVSRDQWKLFGERLNVMKSIFDEAQKNQITHPWFYTKAMTMALGLGWSNKKTEIEVLRPGLQIDPENLQLLRSYKYRLEPRWYGEKNDDYRFFKSVASQIGGDLGAEVYARLILREKLHNITSYQYDLVDRFMFEKGIGEIVRKYPKATQMMRHFMSFAERYDAFDEGLELIKSASPEAYAYFMEEGQYGQIVRLAKQNEIERINYFKPQPNLGGDEITRITWFPDGERYLATSQWRGVHLLDKNGVESLDRFDPKGKPMGAVAVTNDGNYVAAASQYDGNYKRKDTKVYILQVVGDKLELVREYSIPAHDVKHLTFSGDDAYLLVTHQKSANGPRGVFTLNWQDDNVEIDNVYSVGARAGFIPRSISLTGSNEVWVAHKGLKKINLNGKRHIVDVVKQEDIPKGDLHDFCLSSDGRYAVVITGDVWRPENGQQFYVYDTNSGELLIERKVREFAGASWKLAALPLSGEQLHIVMGGHYGGVVQWEIDLSAKTAEVVSAGYGNGQKFIGLAVSPLRDDGVQITAGSWNGMIGNWLVPAK